MRACMHACVYVCVDVRWDTEKVVSLIAFDINT